MVSHCVLVILPLIGLPSAVAAEGTPEDRFRKEYPAAAARLREQLMRVEGSCRFWDTAPGRGGVEPRNPAEADFAFDHGCEKVDIRRYTAPSKGTRSRDDPHIGLVYSTCSADGSLLELVKAPGTDEFVAQGIAMDPDRYGGYVALFRRFPTVRTDVIGRPIAGLMDGKGFRLLDAETIVEGGRELMRVRFEDDSLHERGAVEASVIFDPGAGWIVRSGEFVAGGDDASRVASEVSYDEQGQAAWPPLPRRVAFHTNYCEIICKFLDWRFGPTARGEFGLGHRGMPEVPSGLRRRGLCKNHLKQIGLALHSDHDTVGCLPMGRVESVDARYKFDPSPCVGILDRSFLVAILPFVEQAPLYDAWNQGVSIFTPENLTTRSAAVGGFACPSDPATGVARPALAPQPFPPPRPDLSSVMRASYSGMMGSDYSDARIDPRTCRQDPADVARVNGTINDLSPLTFASISDGLGQTIVAAERYVGLLSRIAIASEPLAEAQYGWWFVGDIAVTLLANNRPPNAFGRGARDRDGSWFDAPSSPHPGGVHVLMADASVRFVRETIQSASEPGEPRGVWQALATRNGSEILTDDSY